MHTAGLILDVADFGAISTAFGEMLAFVNRQALSLASQEDFRLIGTTDWNLQGFLICLMKSDFLTVAGRTTILSQRLASSL